MARTMDDDAWRIESMIGVSRLRVLCLALAGLTIAAGPAWSQNSIKINCPCSPGRFVFPFAIPPDWQKNFESLSVNCLKPEILEKPHYYGQLKCTFLPSIYVQRHIPPDFPNCTVNPSGKAGFICTNNLPTVLAEFSFEVRPSYTFKRGQVRDLRGSLKEGWPNGQPLFWKNAISNTQQNLESPPDRNNRLAVFGPSEPTTAQCLQALQARGANRVSFRALQPGRWVCLQEVSSTVFLIRVDRLDGAGERPKTIVGFARATRESSR